MLLTLPFPPSILSPNRRDHWAVKAPIKKQYREQCGWIAKQHPHSFPDGDISLQITFYPPNNRMDDDNIVGCFKSGRDGLADGWGVNDKRFSPTYVFAEPDKINPRVEITVL